MCISLVIFSYLYHDARFRECKGNSGLAGFKNPPFLCPLATASGHELSLLKGDHTQGPYCLSSVVILSSYNHTGLSSDFPIKIMYIFLMSIVASYFNHDVARSLITAVFVQERT